MDLPVVKRGISGSTLKLIAVITMFIDHAAAVVLLRMRLPSEPWPADIYGYMRNIGRIAFPIYCFLLVEGFQKTRNVYRYALRLGVFALVSEIPFDLAFNGKILEFGYQNVFFTLFTGLLTIIAFDFVDKRVGNQVLKIVLEAAAVLAGFGIACILRTDYAGGGVLCIMVIYIFRKNRILQAIAGYAAFVFLIGFSEIPALPAFILLLFYGGRRGMRLKYVFYLFYPLHLLLLYGVCYYLKLM